MAERGISDRFHFTGFMRQGVYEIYKASDVYVMPSVSEVLWYLSSGEAMQCGVPSIISKQSGCAEILDYAVKVDFLGCRCVGRFDVCPCHLSSDA